jgi:hypothetical protein
LIRPRNRSDIAINSKLALVPLGGVKTLVITERIGNGEKVQ